MTRRLATFALIAALAAPARGAEWSDTDRQLLAAAMLLHVLDWGQTLQIVDDPRYYERNPILGRHPDRGEVNQYFAMTSVAMVLLAHAMPEYRRSMLWGYVAVGAFVVGRNFSIGLRIGF